MKLTNEKISFGLWIQLKCKVLEEVNFNKFLLNIHVEKHKCTAWWVIRKCTHPCKQHSDYKIEQAFQNFLSIFCPNHYSLYTPCLEITTLFTSMDKNKFGLILNFIIMESPSTYDSVPAFYCSSCLQNPNIIVYSSNLLIFILYKSHY